MFVRWNTSSNYWEYDTSAGQTGAGPWILLPNTVYQNYANYFSANQEINKANPSLQFYDSSQPVDQRRFQVIYSGQNLLLQATNDAITNSLGYIYITRGGNIYSTGSVNAVSGFLERGRVIPVGEWQPYTPIWKGSTSDGTIGNGSLSGRYTLIGTTVIFQIRLLTGTTTVYPVGYWAVSVPGVIGGATSVSLGSGFMYNGATGGISTCIGGNGGFILGVFTNCVFPFVDMAGNAAYPTSPLWQTGIPFNWAASPSSWFLFSGMYESG